MNGWIIASALAATSFALLAKIFRLPRKGWEAAGAALVLGIAGYFLQGSPRQPGAPREPAEKVTSGDAAAAIAERQKLNGAGPAANSALVTADAFARHGQFADAAEMLRGTVHKDPGNGQAWLALANALVQHSEGNLSPAALYAFNRAGALDPANPGPPFFLGLALAQSGRLADGRAIWAALLARSPADAPWRNDLSARMAELDAFIARQNGITSGN
ncbi:MAG: tetratricopeptide repeat protein [Novosphingobium sp.]